jgi:beta-mannosidase
MIDGRPLHEAEWRLRGALGDAWRWFRAHEEDPPPLDEGWIPATVPGSVLHDLWQAGAVADPYVGRQSLLAEWVPERTWVYAVRFDEPPRPGRRAWLRFAGLDFEADVFLNGRHLGRHRGMFSEAVFEVGDLLREEPPNALAVVVAPAPAEESQVGRTDRVRTAKARMPYGWDFCPRLVHQGIWDDVTLEWTGATSIADLRVSTDLEGDGAMVRVDVRAHDGAARADAALTWQGARVGRGTAVLDRDGVARLELSVPDPRLWWPAGEGEPALHGLQVTLHDADGAVSDRRRMRVGIRSISLVGNEGAPPDALGYTLRVNGRRVWMRGWNWVPMDALYGLRRPARLAHLVDLARRADVNLLRVWGGGLIEREDFYDACDAAGILVWQEFPLSSSGFDNAPSDDPAYLDHLRGEAEAAIRHRRHHPSLALWCGGNELTDAETRPLDERTAAIALLRDAVERLDPGRAWLPTSPSGPTFHHSLESVERDQDALHDVHGPWEHQGLEAQYELANAGTALLHSEFGAEGMASVPVLERTIPEAERWPAHRGNPVYAHRGAWWDNEPLVQGCFGGRLQDVASLSRASRFLQAEALGYAIEADRRRAWRCSGTIPWQFDEPYPEAWCTTAVDHAGRPKPAYHAVARAYRSVALSARFDRQAWGGHEAFEATVWLSNLSPDHVRGTLSSRIVLIDGSVAFGGDPAAVAIAPATTAEVASVRWAIDGRDAVFLLDLAVRDAAGRLAAERRYLFSTAHDLQPMLELSPASLEATVAVDQDRWQVSVASRGGTAAIGVSLADGRPIDAPGYAVIGDDGFHVLPGERRTVEVVWRDVPDPERALRVDGWNVPGRAVRC